MALWGNGCWSGGRKDGCPVPAPQGERLRAASGPSILCLARGGILSLQRPEGAGHAPEQCAADRQVPPSCFRCSAPGEKTQPVMLQSLGDAGLPSPGLKWEQPPLARLPKTGARPSPRTASRSSEPLLTHLPAFAGLVEGLRKQLLPAWCAPLAHGLSLLLVAVAMGMSGWVGASFPPSVSVMWLLSSGSGFLASFLCWEPFKVRGVRGASLPASGFCGPL